MANDDDNATRSGVSSFGFNSSLVIRSFIIAALSKHGEVNEGHNTKTKQKHVRLKIADLD
jgi:hypothetical protein